MPKFDVEFAKYVQFTHRLERDLVTLHGENKAKRLFRRLSPTEFEGFCEAASSDPLKHRWLQTILAGYTFGESKDAA